MLTTKCIFISLVLVSVFGSCFFSSIQLWQVLPHQPYPQPYPGASVSIAKHVLTGNCCSEDQIRYTINVSAEEVQRHYDQQMHLYCVDTWTWWEYAREELSSEGYTQSRATRCLIKAPPLDQVVTITLSFNDTSKTLVVQDNSWEDW